MLRSVTVTPGSTPPCASATMPTTEALASPCAAAVAASPSVEVTRKIAIRQVQRPEAGVISTSFENGLRKSGYAPVRRWVGGGADLGTWRVWCQDLSAADLSAAASRLRPTVLTVLIEWPGRVAFEFEPRVSI